MVARPGTAPQPPATAPVLSGPGSMAAFSTGAVPGPQRRDYWHNDVLRRLDSQPDEEVRPFHAQLTRLTGEGAELLQHSADSLLARRDAKRCRADGCDEICIDYVVVSTRAVLNHAGMRRLQPGDMVVVDCAQPTEINRSKHRVISLFIPRARVRAVHGDPALLADRLLPRHGIAALLRTHMLATLDQAAHLQPAQRILAIEAASDMALAIFQEAATGRLDAEPFAAGIYQAALAIIGRECTNAELTPCRVAQALGCSRAALYRVFATNGHSVAAAIWSARVAHATQLLQSTVPPQALISDIAFRSGFADHSTFDRMFRRAHGMTPGDMRHAMVKSRP